MIGSGSVVTETSVVADLAGSSPSGVGYGGIEVTLVKATLLDFTICSPVEWFSTGEEGFGSAEICSGHSKESVFGGPFVVVGTSVYAVVGSNVSSASPCSEGMPGLVVGTAMTGVSATSV